MWKLPEQSKNRTATKAKHFWRAANKKGNRTIQPRQKCYQKCLGLVSVAKKNIKSKLPLNPRLEKGSKPLHGCTDSLLCSTKWSGTIKSHSFNCPCTDSDTEEKIAYFLHHISNLCIILEIILFLPFARVALHC